MRIDFECGRSDIKKDDGATISSKFGLKKSRIVRVPCDETYESNIVNNRT